MNLKLPVGIYSQQDLKATITEIRQYAHWLSHATIKKQVSKGAWGEPPGMSSAGVELIKEWIGDKPLDQDSLDKLIETLEDYADNAPRVSVTLAAPPSVGIKKELISWFRKNLDPDMLVDFRFNSTILGGMVVRYGSHIFDWSFRRQILESRQKFPEVLRHV
jgi:hypothetical protein